MHESNRVGNCHSFQKSIKERERGKVWCYVAAFESAAQRKASASGVQALHCVSSGFVGMRGYTLISCPGRCLLKETANSDLAGLHTLTTVGYKARCTHEGTANQIT